MFIPASPVRLEHHFIGLHILMETRRRFFGNNFGALPDAITEDAWAQGGYCLDAPDTMAAGACYQHSIWDGEQKVLFAEQITCEREGVIHE